MKLALSPEQPAMIGPHLRPGTVLLGRVDREPFTGSNAATSGALVLVFTGIPSERLDAVRLAIAGQAAPGRRRARA